MRSSQSAPGRLELIREFVNTRDVEEDSDEFVDLAGTASWLEAHELLPSGAAAVTGADRERLLALREGLRELLLANNRGESAPDAALQTLNECARGIALEPRFEPVGAKLASAGGGVNRALGELLAIVYSSMREGDWMRLKACPAEDCLWAFYDRSRNRSATWCQMGECGNRSKARAFRARRRREPGES